MVTERDTDTIESQTTAINESNSESIVNHDSIKASLDTSSDKNRNHFISFILVEIYMLVTVGATTDMQLLIPNSRVHLPIINIDLPLFSFFAFAPILLLSVHFNLLFNLLQHSKKLYMWDREATGDERKGLLQPFLFNFLVRFKPGQINYHLLRIIIYCMIYLFPILVLALIQFKFSRYHSFPMTLWHFTMLFIDLMLLKIYWRRIVNPEFIGDDYENWQSICNSQISPMISDFKKIFGVLLHLLIFLSLFFLCFILANLSYSIPDSVVFILLFWIASGLVGIFVYGTTLWHGSIISNVHFMLWRTILFLPIWILLWKLIRIVFIIIIKPRITLKKLNNTVYFKPIVIFFNEKFNSCVLLTIITVSFVNFLLVFSLFVNIIPFKNIDVMRFFYPNLTINEKTLVARNPSDTIISYYLAKNKNKETDWLPFFGGLNLEKRDLRYAVLSNSKLYKAKLEKAQLQGADLRYTQLQRADLKNAQLQGARLWYAQLQGADLKNAQLQGADLKNAQLQGADLKNAQLQEARLMNAQLQGTDLEDTQLQGADLEDTQLQGANLRRTQLQGADLKNAQLQGAFLSGILLNGINFEDIDTKYSWCQGIDFKISYPFYYDRSKEFDLKGAKERFKTNINFDEFLEKRQELACEDKYVAESLYRQLKDMAMQIWILDGKLNNDILSKLRSKYSKYKQNSIEEIEQKIFYDDFLRYDMKDIIKKHFPGIIKEISLNKQKNIDNLRKHLKTNCPEIEKKIDWSK
ncbi:pentapeptide repeat-containing protein [Desulfobacterales bacterium HSG16]|nr:pentapeptide repeat-containing protein [Desulfobacterales bacterium HSG16]